MDKQSRRQAVRDFKERKTLRGVFAVCCAATGEVWVGGSRNLDQQQNSIWFGLRRGGLPWGGCARWGGSGAAVGAGVGASAVRGWWVPWWRGACRRGVLS